MYDDYYKRLILTTKELRDILNSATTRKIIREGNHRYFPYVDHLFHLNGDKQQLREMLEDRYQYHHSFLKKDPELRRRSTHLSFLYPVYYYHCLINALYALELNGVDEKKNRPLFEEILDRLDEDGGQTWAAFCMLLPDYSPEAFDAFTEGLCAAHDQILKKVDELEVQEINPCFGVRFFDEGAEEYEVEGFMDEHGNYYSSAEEYCREYGLPHLTADQLIDSGDLHHI